MNWTKKSFAVFFLLFLCLALCACGKTDGEAPDAEQDKATILSCIALLGKEEQALVSQLGEGERTLLDGTKETLFREYALSLFGQSIPFMATIDLGYVLDFSAALEGSYDDWAKLVKTSLGDPDTPDEEQANDKEARWSLEGGGLCLSLAQDTLTLSFYQDEG